VSIALFQPDRFSDAAPHYRVADAGTVTEVEQLINQHYNRQIGRITGIEQHGGAEINSKNFKIHAEHGLFLLKKSPGAKIGSNIELDLGRELELLTWLAERGHPVPSPVAADDGVLHVQKGDTAWHLMSFVEGNYFSGTAGMISPIGEAIGRLHRDLGRIPDALIPDKQLPDTRAMDADIFLRIERTSVNWSALFGDTDAAIIRANWPLIMETNDALEERWDELQETPRQPAHIDLHPHNIIMRGNDVASILDFDSCMMAPVTRVVGFAAYKLMRQACVNGNSKSRNDPEKSAATFLEALFRGFAMSNRDRRLLPLQAKAEVMRRLALILRLNFEDQDFNWNWVLPIHLSGLHEIDHLFAMDAKDSGVLI